MALINCQECGKEVSERAKFCPHCGLKLAQPIGNFKGCLRITLLFLALVAGVIIVQAVFFSKEKQHPPLEVCKMMLKMQSANPDNVSISDVNGTQIGNEITYIWTPFDLKLQNTHGALVGVSATCSVDTETGKVRFILIDDALPAPSASRSKYFLSQGKLLPAPLSRTMFPVY